MGNIQWTSQGVDVHTNVNANANANQLNIVVKTAQVVQPCAYSVPRSVVPFVPYASMLSGRLIRQTSPQTRADVVAMCGEPVTETLNREGFYSQSYDEDYFLNSGGRDIFDRRLIFSVSSPIEIAYVDTNANVIAIF
jgi:hypothetical protein